MEGLREVGSPFSEILRFSLKYKLATSENLLAINLRNIGIYLSVLNKSRRANFTDVLYSVKYRNNIIRI